MEDRYLKMYMDNLNTSINKLDSNIGRLYEKQDKMNTILAQNTITVKEHHLRSNRMEEVQKELVATLQDVSHSISTLQLKVNEIESNVENIDSDIEPVKQHVEKLNNDIGFLTNLPKSAKFIGALIAAFMVISGIANGTSTVQDLLQLFMK